MLGAAVGWMGAGGAAWAQNRRAHERGDLDGLWTMASFTDLERPAGIWGLVLSPAEAEAYEAPRRALNGMLPSKPGEVGQAESEFTDRGTGLARVRGQIRSSWIVDPPDGRIPYRPEVLAKFDKHKDPPFRHFDNPEELTGPERCVASLAAGAPMVGGPDANLVQIVQTEGCVAIVVEKYHDARIVRLTEPRPAEALAPSWLGESVGRWEGPSLVVETAGFRNGVQHRGARLYLSDATQVTERFTRTAPGELLYEFTVNDPTLFTQVWRGETTFRAQSGVMYEYACHEGNYAMPGMLAGARREQQELAGR